MNKMKAIIASSLLSIGFLSGNIANAQTAPSSSSGSATGNMTIKATVPQMCDIKTGTFFNFDMGEFLNIEKQQTSYYLLKCKTNTTIKISIGLGTNPNSTATKRRMPLNGEAGDVKHYLEYSLHYSSPNQPAIGADGITRNLGTVSSSGENFPLVARLYATQPALAVGTYSDDLDVTIDYQ